MTSTRLLRNLLLALAVIALAACGKSHCSDATANGGDDEEQSPIIASDLSNQKITALAEDAQGYIWIGTFRGLNKYNVHEYHQYYCTDDTINLPDNQITDLMSDSKGRLWVATVNGLCQYTDQDNFRHIPQDYENRNGVQLIETRDGRVLLSTMHQLAVYDPETDSLKQVVKVFDPDHSFQTKCFIDPSNRLWVTTPKRLRCFDLSTYKVTTEIAMPFVCTYSFMQKDGTLWITGDGQVALFDTYTRHFKPTPASISQNSALASTAINLIHPYGDDCLLISTERKGLMLYNYAEDRITAESDNSFPFKPPHANVNGMFTDSQGNLWIGTEDQGYTVIYNSKERFNTDHYLTQRLSHTTVTSVAHDKQGNLWLGTLSDGIYVYDLSQKTMQNFSAEQLLDGTQYHKTKHTSVFIDNNDNVWVRLMLNHKVFRCRYDGNTLHKEQSYDMFMPMSMAQDEQGTIYVGTCYWMMYAMRRGESQFTVIEALQKHGTFIPGLLPLGDNRLWVMAFMQPITEVNTLTRKSRKAAISDKDWQACISRSVFIPTASIRDSKGDVWIGTVANGLLHYNTATKRLTRVPGAPCKDISSIEEDTQGNIWVSTQYGLGKYSRATGKFTNYFANDGIGGNQFYDRASCRLPDGTLVFGGTHGLTVFNPTEVGAKRNIPLLFEDLTIHNRHILPGEGQPISKHLSLKPEVRLNHTENSFGISFSALDYREHERVHYFYKMDGVDKDWIDAHNTRVAYYANLPAGTYTFRVKVTNNDMNIVETEDSLQVVVEPAPWLSWWAWLIYAALLAAAVYFIVRTRRRIIQEKEATEKANREKEQEQRINKMNMSFFANISHEFRTPLTTISGPISQLGASPNLSDDDRHMLSIVNRSVKRMLRLVNQLLDFNKLTDDALQLQVRSTDVIAQLRALADTFSVTARDKGVTLTARGLEDSFTMWLDADKLDKIMVNLLSNAMKFTPHGGNIEIAFDANGNTAKITVTDTGSGIPADATEKIFKRYYQLNNQPNATHNVGTGIGLYYSRRLAELHHGTLTAAGRTDGTHGAVFTLLLPTGAAAYTDAERLPDELQQADAFPLSDSDAFAEGGDKAGSEAHDNRPHLVVVDDDTEVLHYLNVLLSKHYNVTCCTEAKIALREMGEHAPDLVMSDVAMPETSGYELCQLIKEDLQLCHIPVILVTAKATVENQVEGLNTGADAYVTKPFDPNYLLALIASMLKNREKMRSLLNKSTQTGDMDQNMLSPQDRTFMTELYQLMESELANSDLDISSMTRQLGFSRTKFYYKVKGLTGETPSVFFKTYKLNRAAELIKEGKNTVTEIAYMTGFSTLSHFSTVFKKQFGVAPSDYAKHSPAQPTSST